MSQCAPTGRVTPFCDSLLTGAAAQTASLTGHWNVEAEHAYSGCRISGSAIVTASEHGNDYRADIVLHQACPDGRQWDATQSCLLTSTDAFIVVECTLISATPANYRPDNFALEQRSATTLEGTLQSNLRWSTRWTRPAGALVS